jgi:hypothetical protein
MKNLNRFILLSLCIGARTIGVEAVAPVTPVTAARLKAAVKVAKNLKNAATTKSTGSTGKTPVLVQLEQNRFKYSGPAPQCTATMSPVQADLDSVYGPTFSCEDGVQSVNIGLTDAQGKTFLILVIGQASLTQAGIYSADGTGATYPEFYIGIDILGAGTTATPYKVQVVFLSPQGNELLTARYTVQSTTEGFAYANIGINCSDTLIALPTNAVAANWFPVIPTGQTYSGQPLTGSVVHYLQSSTTTTPPVYGGTTVPGAVVNVAAKTTPVQTVAAVNKPAVTTTQQPQQVGPQFQYNFLPNSFVLGMGNPTATPAVAPDMASGQLAAAATAFTPIVNGPQAAQYSGAGTPVAVPTGGLVRLNVGVTDGSGAFLTFNFNREMFNTMQMQNLIQMGMYIVVNLITTPNPAIQVLLTDAQGNVYAQGTQQVSANINPTHYYVGFNTDDNNNANGTTKIGVDAVPIGQSLFYVQPMQTSTLNYLTVGDGAAAGPGNQNIANITPLICDNISTTGTFNVGAKPFTASTATVTSTNIYNPNQTPYVCQGGLNKINVGIFDGQSNFIAFDFGPNKIFGNQQMQDLLQLGLFVLVDLVQNPTPMVNVYLCDVNGVVYAQGTYNMSSANATPTSYYVGLNTYDNNNANGTTKIGVNAVPFFNNAGQPTNLVVWYQQSDKIVAQQQLATGQLTQNLPKPIVRTVTVQRPVIYAAQNGNPVSTATPLTSVTLQILDPYGNNIYKTTLGSKSLNSAAIAPLLVPQGNGVFIKAGLKDAQSQNLTIVLTDQSGTVVKTITTSGAPWMNSLNVFFNQGQASATSVTGIPLKPQGGVGFASVNPLTAAPSVWYAYEPGTTTPAIS